MLGSSARQSFLSVKSPVYVKQELFLKPINNANGSAATSIINDWPCCLQIQNELSANVGGQAAGEQACPRLCAPNKNLPDLQKPLLAAWKASFILLFLAGPMSEGLSDEQQGQKKPLQMCYKNDSVES